MYLVETKVPAIALEIFFNTKKLFERNKINLNSFLVKQIEFPQPTCLIMRNPPRESVRKPGSRTRLPILPC